MQKSSSFNLDIILLAATLALIVIGILFIYSSGVSSTGVQQSDEHLKQILWAVIGILLLILFLLIDYNAFKNVAPVAYGISLLILLFTLLFGKVVNGARSWLDLGFMGFQPSEFTKITTILLLAAYLENNRKKIHRLSYFLLGFAVCAAPVGLILLQPDMGTALVFFPMFMIMAFISGAKLRHIFFLLLTCLLTVLITVIPEIEKLLISGRFPVLNVLKSRQFILLLCAPLTAIIGLSVWGFFAFKNSIFYWIIYFVSITVSSLIGSIGANLVLKEYQIMRLISFINPYVDAKGIGWNIIQSVTAVGSGGFAGKGYLHGTQSHLQYLPQQSTDFIFSIIAEEWGFIGCSLILILFLVILYRSIKIISNTKDLYAILSGAGIVSVIFFHIVINVGMTMGIMPITGIPLLFLSYGGSSLLTALIFIGILLNISFRKFK